MVLLELWSTGFRVMSRQSLRSTESGSPKFSTHQHPS